MSDKILIHTSQMKLRWGDMDAFGHVNNTIYFRYMEQTRIEWLEQAGSSMVIDEHGPVIVNASCTFLRQLKYPADIEIRMYAQSPGRSSFETAYEIRRIDQPDTLYAEGSAKVVWVNFREEKSVPLPDAIRKMLTAL